MFWSRTLLRVIAWIVLIGPNLPGPPLANPGRPVPPSITEPSLLDSILDLLPAPIRLIYPPPPPYVEPLSFTLTSSAAWLCSPSLSSHGHCPTPDRSRLSASKEYIVRSASSLAERASAVVWLATPHALLRSKPAALLSRTSSRTKQALSVMRLKVVNPVFDLIVRPKTTTSIRVSAPSTQTWSGTNPAPPRAGHGWRRGRVCTYSHKPTKSPAFPSIYMVGESIRNWMDMVSTRLVGVLSFMVSNLEYTQLWAKSFGQRAYDHPNAVFAAVLDSLSLIWEELWSVVLGFEGVASHVISSPGIVFMYYQSWFAPHIVAGLKIMMDMLPTSAQLSIFVNPLSSASHSILHWAQDTTSRYLLLARSVAKHYHFQMPPRFGHLVQLVLAHPFPALLGLWYLSMALVCLSLLVWFIRAPEDRLLAYIRVDRSHITQALAQMIVMYLALERSRRSRRNDTTSGSRGDSHPSEDRGTDYGECADLREVETEQLIPSSSFISNISPSLARRQAWPSRSLIEYQPIMDANGEQTNAGVYQSECTPVSASTLLDDRLREALTLVLSYIWRATCSTLCSAPQMDPVVVNGAFRDLVYGNPCVRLQMYSSTSAFFASLFVRLYPRPKSMLLIEYPQPLEVLAPVPNILFLAGRHREVLRLVRPHLEASALAESSLLAGPSQLVARAFRSVVFGDPYLRLVTQMSIAVFLEGLFARFEVRVGKPAKPRLMIEYRRSTEVAHNASGDTVGPVSDPDASISYLALHLSLGQRKEVVALVLGYVDTRKAEYMYPLVMSANIFVHHAFRSSVLGDSSSGAGFLELLAAFYAPLVVRLKEYRPELDLIRLTRRTPPRVRPGAEMYRPRALKRDDSSNEERRQRLAKQEQRLIEAARRREQAAQEEPQSLSDAPTKRRRRPRAGRKVRERREREEEERLTLLGSVLEEET